MLSGRTGSCWLANAPATRFPALSGHMVCDVVVVGGGIVGLTTALTLCQHGKSVVVVEARRIGDQVTGRSSAKITAQHGLIYAHLTGHFGKALARSYADANRAGMTRIKTWIDEFAIACDYETKGAYAYIHDAGQRGRLQEEAGAARALGFEVQVLDRAPLPFDTKGALLFPGQAQFNPSAYLIGLAKAVGQHGGRVFEQSRARTIEEGHRWRVETEQGQVDAEYIVIATNITVKSPVGYANRTLPRCHIAMAFRLHDAAAIDGMFIGLDEPTRSIRTGRDRDGDLLLTLGPRFITGQDGNVAARFEELEAWTRANLPAGETLWRWCNEDYDTADRVPYVGQPAPAESPGFYVATGFNGWGISNGTAAGMMIAADIATGAHPWGALYDPRRPHPDKFNPGGDSQSLVASIDEIAPGQGGVVTRGDAKLAVWRGPNGALEVLSAECTHKGCIVTWNNADGTWDCPCHGSVFEADGTVVHGPAREPLPRRDL
jgi:glycine/D-amino acid oxidase-like deaminating enzyme/nitrite reductase/ring-hydroxylating ferredoxin subunit